MCNGITVKGQSFDILATQEVEFVPLKKYEDSVFEVIIPRKMNLRSEQSSVKSQGQRGGCTYFVMSSLLESLIIKRQKIEVDISEEYIAWASKVKNKLRVEEEDSSVAVNASTIQKYGFLLEKDFPYQQSWFDKGMPCDSQKNKKRIDPICYSHKQPSAESMKKLIDGSSFVFEAIDSGSMDVVKAMARLNSPITASVRAHPKTWEQSVRTGEIVFNEQLMNECISKVTKCSAHAILIVGYDLDKRIFSFKNSWGPEWGDKGYGFISFDYMDQLSPRKFMAGILVQDTKLTQSAKF